MPNWLTLGITLTGLALATARLSGLSLGAAFAGFLLGLAVMLPGHLIGATGAGDVKLFAALGTLLGPRAVFFAFVYTAIAGGVLAVAVAMRRRRLRRTMERTAMLRRSRRRERRGDRTGIDRTTDSRTRRRSRSGRSWRRLGFWRSDTSLGTSYGSHARVHRARAGHWRRAARSPSPPTTTCRSMPAKTVSMPTKPVVVAATDLDIGAELTRGRRPHRSTGRPTPCPPTRFTDPKDVIGRGLVMPVIQNEPILPMKLASKEAGAGLPPAIPPGLRAVSVRVNEVIGVAGYVLPGTRVDVVATVSPTQQPGRHDVEGRFSPTCRCSRPARRSSATPTRTSRSPVSVVTLLVDPERGRAADAREHRRQDSARAAQPARQDDAGDPRRQPGGAARRAPATTPRRGRERRAAERGRRRAAARPGAGDGRNHPRRQTRTRSRAAGVTIMTASRRTIRDRRPVS